MEMTQVGETRLASEQFERIVAQLTALQVSQTQLPHKQLRQILAALLTTSGLDPEQAVTRYQGILARIEYGPAA
jgi:hypothetical protein